MHFSSMLRVSIWCLWPFVANLEATYSLNLDNREVADEIDLLQDPFLQFRSNGCKPCDFPILEALSVRVNGDKNLFDYEKPSFSLSVEAYAPEKIWWQIGVDGDFENVCVEDLAPFTSQILLDNLQETFLNPCEDYYLRVKVIEDGFASPWSPSFVFQVIKPERIQEPVYVYDSAFEQDRLIFDDHFGLCEKITRPLQELLEPFYANPYISYDIWQKVKPYILPQNHPARGALNILFGRTRVSASINAMNAGFITKGPGRWSKTVFGRRTN